MVLPKKDKPGRKNHPLSGPLAASALLARFQAYLTDTKGLKPASVKNYLSDLRAFFRWQNKNGRFSILTLFKKQNRSPKLGLPSTAALQAYKNHLLAQKRAKSSINRRLASIRVFCQFGYDLGLSEHNPARGLTNLAVRPSAEKKINDLVSRFGADLKKKGASRNTIKNYTADVRRFLLSGQEGE